MQVKKQQLEPDMKQQNGSQLKKGYVKTVCCQPFYLTYAKYIMQNARLDEAQAGQDCCEKYQLSQICR